jgi:hypothetical protein
MISDFQFINIVQNGDRVFMAYMTYEGRGKAGRRFRNTEILTVRGARSSTLRSISVGQSFTKRRPAAESNRECVSRHSAWQGFIS